MKPWYRARVVSLLPLSFLAACGGGSEADPAQSVEVPAERVAYIRSVEVQPEETMDLAILSADLLPVRRATLASEVAGRVEQLTVDVGDRVRQGQILVRIDTRALRQQIAEAEALFVQAVDRFGCDGEGCVKAEGNVSHRHIVVNRLGDTDDRQAHLMKLLSGGKRSIATHDDQTFQLEKFERLLDLVDRFRRDFRAAIDTPTGAPEKEEAIARNLRGQSVFSARARIEVLRATDDGFRIAEEDLRLRGPGEVLGTRQSGLPTLHLADLGAHADLLAPARDDARRILERDPRLRSDRGHALRILLELFERQPALAYLGAG